MLNTTGASQLCTQDMEDRPAASDADWVDIGPIQVNTKEAAATCDCKLEQLRSRSKACDRVSAG